MGGEKEKNFQKNLTPKTAQAVSYKHLEYCTKHFIQSTFKSLMVKDIKKEIKKKIQKACLSFFLSSFIED